MLTPIELRKTTKAFLMVMKGNKKTNSRSECPEEIMIHQKALQLESEGHLYVDEYVKLFKEIYTLVKTGQVSFQDCFENLLSGKIGWKSVAYFPFVEEERKEIINLTKPIEVEEGIYRCPKCKGKKTHHYSRQMRSADEPSTTFITCASSLCQYKWKIN
jgi:DNA-directed RNA polymerase subunit M/transcription elongation factor TFIIS